MKVPGGYVIVREEDCNSLIALVQELAARVRELEAELSIYKHRKNSNNSSIPPSKDENRPKRNQSLREKSGKKSGGQPGHTGSTLKMVETPDKVEAHIPGICHNCGNDLTDMKEELLDKRQVFDIIMTQVITQHERYKKVCSCGTICKGSFPDNVKGPVQYSTNIEALNAYFSARHYIPFNRLSEIYRDVFNLPISEGTIANLLERFYKNASIRYEQIRREIEKSPVVGADETGIKVDGKKWWLWGWQDKLNTFLVASANRGSKTIDETFPEGLPNAILVSDAWQPHLKMACREHQLCIAHLLREINYFIELNPKNEWAKNIKSVLKTGIELKKDFFDADYLYLCEELKKDLKNLLEIPPESKDKRLIAFYKRLVKNEEALLTFLKNQDVPPDNNGSERSIRNAKPKMKISGQFKTGAGAEIFAVIRSVIDTYIKRGGNIFGELNNMAALVPT
jgi:transposase